MENRLTVTNMQKCAGFLTIFYFFVYLRINSTHPFHRDNVTKVGHQTYPNMSQRCVLMERTKTMASNLENTLRRFKDSTQDFGKSIYDHLNTGIKTLANRDAITEDEIRQYEELVIMKKHPYIDLKALEMKYSPLPSKNTRQSATFVVDRRIQNEPGINCDTVEELLNVEIINRGLSGFFIPSLLAKHTESADSKLVNNVRKINMANEINTFTVGLPSDRNVIKSLKDDIKAYMERKGTE
ncbi:uncharacterized protein LOC120627054 [Pararge aegeria]|uniref:uncharacterized protein LOC120627054 n=1 Tax=Pararge aegeria TaxID=116150 RepID=UPI0019CF8291|nr:uncharacterized protein LOC120627054 [Pararge aegeria]